MSRPVLIHDYDECLCHDTEIEDGRRTTEMRVIVRFEGSDGSVWECNKVIKCRLRRTKPRTTPSPLPSGA